MTKRFVLPDTSIWIDHLAGRAPAIARLLREDRIRTHPAVIGELALGSLADRRRILRDISRLEKVHVARDWEVMALIEDAGLGRVGIGWVDAHLSASILLSPETVLWTLDKRLALLGEKPIFSGKIVVEAPD